MWKFFSKQQEKDLHQKMTDHLSRIHSATKALLSAVDAWRNHDLSTLDREAGEISNAEDAADRILSEIWLDLAKGSLPTKLQSNIVTFMKRADEVADNAKKASYNFLILHEFSFSEHIYQAVYKACELLHKCSERLIEALEIYRRDIEQTIDLTTEISSLEHQIDALYSQLKHHYFDLHEFTDNFATLLIFDHAIQDIEQAANSAEDAADVLHSIVIGEL
ncbi:MAG: DUF47 family protein [Candidatus Heimdallarchaeota archaeon]|nr:DUF47 family protein [Candidatus Heimdallarchaeota archaeon]